jgi:hypothetical protein
VVVTGAVVNVTSNAVMFGKKEGTITYTIDGREFSVKFFYEMKVPGVGNVVSAREVSGNETQIDLSVPSGGYGPMGVLVPRLIFSEINPNDPIFGKIPNNTTLFRNDNNRGAIGIRGLTPRPPVWVWIPTGPGKWDRNWVGKWYSDEFGARCNVQESLILEITANQKIKIGSGSEMDITGFVLFTANTERRVADGLPPDRRASTSTGIVFSNNGRADTVRLAHAAVQGNKNLARLTASPRAGGALHTAWNGSQILHRANRSHEIDANFDQNLLGAWYFEAPVAAQFFRGAVSAESRETFIIMEHNCRFFYNNNSMRMTTPGNGKMVIGRNEFGYTVEGNKLTITGGVEGNRGGGMGVQLRNGEYFRFDPSLPPVTENEVAAEAGRGAAGLFRR